MYVKRGRGYKGGMQDGYVMGCIEPTILLQDRSVASCEADTAELNIVAEGSTLRYIWQKYNTTTKMFEDFVPPAGSSVEGLGSHNLKFTPLTLDDNGMYMCKLQNENILSRASPHSLLALTKYTPSLSFWFNKSFR